MTLKTLINKTDYSSLKYFSLYSKDSLPNKVKLSGWIKTYRDQGELIFMSINDGTTHNNLQVLFDINNNFADDPLEVQNKLKELSVSGSVELRGIMVKPPDSSKEKLELHVTDVDYIGVIRDKQSYILSKGRVKPEVMRKHQHIRFKANYFAAIMKIRSKAIDGLREFFNNNDFYHIDPNVVTTSDCEGAGEVFEIVAPSDKIKKELFFGKKAYLTVSSQLQLEAACSGLGRCYTMNPSFRAEKSNTSRHLASFTHIEYEASFGGLDDLLNLSENMVKHVIRKCLSECKDEYKFLNGYYSKGIIERLTKFSNDSLYPRLSYDDALEMLIQAKKKKKLKIEDCDMPKWGDDLGSACEKYLAEEVYSSPIMVFNYPKKLKSFYMKEDEQNPLVVNCMDLLVPNIGELIGSSVREDNYDKLLENIRNKSIPEDTLDWYIDLRKNGTWRHYGGGLGFERLVGLLTMDNKNFNVRDCCPFPVSYGECEY
jgi:asparaginyl-tRNA synthetase